MYIEEIVDNSKRHYTIHLILQFAAELMLYKFQLHLNIILLCVWSLEVVIKLIKSYYTCTY